MKFSWKKTVERSFICVCVVTNQFFVFIFVIVLYFSQDGFKCSLFEDAFMVIVRMLCDVRETNQFSKYKKILPYLFAYERLIALSSNHHASNRQMNPILLKNTL